MTTVFGSRIRQGNGVTVAKDGNDDRVGEMLSDSSDDGSPLGGNIRRNIGKKLTTTRSNDSDVSSLRSSSASEGGKTENVAGNWRSSNSERRDVAKREDAVMNAKTKIEPLKGLHVLKKTSGTLARSRNLRNSSSTKKSTGRKWYSDSDEEEEESKKNHLKIESTEEDSDLDAYIAGSVVHPHQNKKEKSRLRSKLQVPQKRNRLKIRKERESDWDSDISKEAGEASATGNGAKNTNMLKLITKTKVMSPFGWKEKKNMTKDLGPSATNCPAEAKTKSKRDAPLTTEHSTSKPSVTISTRGGRPTEVQTGGAGSSPAVIINRRTDRLKHSASGSEYGGSPRVTANSAEEVVSPGLRKVPGAFPGRPGSGVLLEGWLRQKQRRGIKGLKKWNSRYFVLYAKLNEVRYYADVVQSAWGPIPLGEIGSISLRLIQRIGKLSHPKYKGCRFDITCRNTWGTHYADDYVSSDEENANASNQAAPNSNSEKPTSTSTKQEKSGTPKSSRVYSLVSDSPQVTVMWVNMLDSLLIRSANSPRPDIDSPAENTSVISATSASGRARRSRTVARQQSSTLETELSVLLRPEELVPKATIYAINFIYDSTPGIETERFYEVKPNTAKLKAALDFLNEFSSESVTRKPTKDELEELLDATTAGAIVRLWLKQQEQPLIPYTMFDEFVTLAREAQYAPFDSQRNLQTLIEALPKKNLTMLACLLFHLNDVNVYSSKNGMDAARLAHHFTEFILRPQENTPVADSSTDDARMICRLVEEMITNVDTLIDEKEAQLLEDNRL
ncbi:putative Rho GTPase activation protein [Plasmopara halstedii]